MVLASIASMNNLSVPPASVCSGDGCRAAAYAAALQADCTFTSQVFDDWNTFEKEYFGSSSATRTRCSAFGNQTCVSLDHKNYSTLANFTSGPSNACSQVLRRECPAGDFAVIYGIWISQDYEDSNPPTKVHTVDCSVSYGKVTIVQDGQSTPSLDRTSFAKSEATLPRSETVPRVLSNGTTRNSSKRTAVWLWQNTYLRYDLDADESESPYTFHLGSGDLRIMDSLGRYLLVLPNITEGMTDDTAMVARKIEANFDAATLFAFSRAPEAASVHITHTDHVNIWSYDPRVLAILIPPLLATILILCTRWRIYSDNVVIGYNPIAIARRAEEILASLSTTSANSGKEPGWKPDHTRGDYATIPRDEISLATLDLSERRASSSTLRPVVSEETIANQQAGPFEETNSIEQVGVGERQLV